MILGSMMFIEGDKAVFNYTVPAKRWREEPGVVLMEAEDVSRRELVENGYKFKTVQTSTQPHYDAALDYFTIVSVAYLDLRHLRPQWNLRVV